MELTPGKGYISEHSRYIQNEAGQNMGKGKDEVSLQRATKRRENDEKAMKMLEMYDVVDEVWPSVVFETNFVKFETRKKLELQILVSLQ